MLDLVFAARPMLHLPIWSIFLVSLFYHHQLSNESFRWSDAGMMACLSLLAAGAYYFNQIYDRSTDRINRKLGFLQEGCFTENELMVSYLIVSLLAIGCALLYSVFILIVFLQLFVLGYIYSASPLRLKDRPIFGILANGYAFGFLVPFTVMPDLTFDNAGLLGWDNPIYFFLAVASIYLLTTLPDREGDRATGKRTVAVILTPWLVKLLAVLLMLLAAFIAGRTHRDLLALLALVSALPTIASLFIFSQKIILLAAKLPILLLTLLAGYFYPLYLACIILRLIFSRLYYKRRFNLMYPRLA
ncbi:MAG: UbiA family prenyltransferase [Candidatus Zixiibacteriota bacterium]